VALLRPKGKRNRENKLNLNEGTILCLLDRGNIGADFIEFLGVIFVFGLIAGFLRAQMRKLLKKREKTAQKLTEINKNVQKLTKTKKK